MHFDKRSKQILRRMTVSYFHKASLLALAVIGFTSLNWLGNQKERYERWQERRWVVTGAIRSAIKDAGGEPICTTFRRQNWCDSVAFETREQLISAIQDVAEVPVWTQFNLAIATARAEFLKQASTGPASGPEKMKALYAHFADVFGKEELYAKASAAAIRKSVSTRLSTLDIKAAEPEKLSGFEHLIQPALDSESDTYIIYEILWYATLILGVLASSMLVLIVFTALPITDSEGYWSKRIGELLDRSPAAVRRSIMTPLLTASLAGGTIAGTVMATEPGGTARTYIDESTGTDQRIQAMHRSKMDARTYRGGDTSITHEWPGPESPAEIDLAPIINSIDVLTGATTAGLADLNTALDRTGSSTIAKMEELRGSVNDNILQAAAGVKRKAAEFDEPVNTTASNAEKTLRLASDNLEPAIKKTEVGVIDLIEEVNGHVEQSTLDADQIKGTQQRQESTFKRSLAQNAQRDPRGFLGRTFGFTLFQVGPLVAETMDARLSELRAPDEDRDVLRKALSTMQASKPLDRWQFEKRLRRALQDSGATSSQIDAIVTTHFGALRGTCALPR